MKNLCKIAAVAAAGAVAVAAFGAMLNSSVQQSHGSSAHGQMELKIKMSGFQMALTHIVDHEYKVMLGHSGDAPQQKSIHESQHKAMMAILTPEQQAEAVKAMIKEHPDLAGHMTPVKSMVKTLAELSDAQQKQLSDLHEKIQSHMSGLSEEQIAAIHEGKAGEEAEAHLKAMAAEIRALLSVPQGREWDAILEYVSVEKRRLMPH